MAMRPQLRPAAGRYRMVLAAGMLGAACGLLAAGCGSTAAPGSVANGASASSSPAGGTHSASSPSSRSAAKASLEVSLTRGAGGATEHWTLRCDPPGGTTPDPAATCSRLLADKAIFQPHRGHYMCPMIMAGARVYIVTGTWYGQKVHETVVDGACDLARWSQLNKIFN